MKSTNPPPEMAAQNHASADAGITSRRAVLAATGTTALVSSAGCLGLLSTESEDRCEDEDVTVVLDEPPEDDIQLENPPYPDYGESIPEVTAPAPLHDREVTTTEFICERHTLYTFIFTRCHEACPALSATLRHVQADSIDEGYEDEVAFLQYTFDPEYDTPEVLDEYERRHGVNQDPGHWYSLRPESQARAKEVVHETFGQEYVKVEDHQDHGQEHGDHGDGDEDGFDPDDLDGIGDDIGDGDEHDHDENDHDHDQMPFQHLSLILLVNKAGYVERAYAYDVPNYQRVIDDTRELIERW